MSNTRWFGAYFFLSAMVIVLVFMIYTQIFVVQAIRQDNRQMISSLAFFYSLATRDTVVVQESGPDMNVIFETITNTNFPVIVTDDKGEPQLWKAIGVSPKDTSPEALKRVRRQARLLDLENRPFPFTIPDIGPRALHYGDSALVKRLSWLPWVALFVTVLFIGVGYLGFRNIKNSEQRSIWVGMARETAHQLGTPLSSLYGWIELMRAELQERGESEPARAAQRLNQLIDEVESDTSRLNKIASRFSLIGSSPELRLGQLAEVVGDTVSYLSDRLPSDIQIRQAIGAVAALPMNRQLLGWAFENLLKNAADALEGKGGRIKVSAQMRPDNEWVDIRVADSGKGITSHLVKQVFLPGYSTKKRGWGLGLAFVKRIVEDYHRGRITVEESTPDVGTTFLITLPAAPPEAG
jgi:NtrC-family two-component system sensor histidine kinase KinB